MTETEFSSWLMINYCNYRIENSAVLTVYNTNSKIMGLTHILVCY